MKPIIEKWRKFMIEDKAADIDKIVKAVLVSENAVFLLRRAPSESHSDKWDLPGGHLIEGEHPEDGLLREVWEETGLRIKSPVELYSQGKNTYFKAKMPPGKAKLSDEHTEHAMVHSEELSEYSLPEKYLNAIKRALK